MSSFAAPQVYLITDRHRTAGRSLGVVVTAALEGAAELRARGLAPRLAVQLREKDLSGGPLYALAAELRTITRHAGADLYVNDRVDVALACGADGVHLGSGSLDVAVVRRIAPSLRVAVSTHSRPDLERAASAGASFAVFGPIFDTEKATHSVNGKKGPEGLAQALAGPGAASPLDLPVLALGGVTPHTTPACLRAGAAGVAFVRAAMEAHDPAAVTRMFLSSFFPQASI